MGIKLTGTGQSEEAGQSLEGIIFRAASGALQDAGIERSDIDGVVIAASDQVDGRAISSMLTSGPAGAYLNEEINVASSPGHALALAYMQIASGTHRRLLVSSWGKASETEGARTEGAERLSAEPFFERDAGLSRIAAAGLQAEVHRRNRRDPDRSDLAAATVAARNHGSAVTVDDVLASPLVATPLRELEWPVETDGAFSLVVERPDRDVERAVEIEGIGWCADSGRIADRDLVGVPHLGLAASAAYRQAGITSPKEEIGAWWLHDYTPDAEILAYPALGLCDLEDALDRALEGWDVDVAINPAGGSVAGEAPFGGSLGKVVAAVRQLQAEREFERVGVQMSTGFAGQFQSVFILGGES